MIPYQHEDIREPKWTKTRREGDLRRLVQNTIVESPAREEWAVSRMSEKCRPVDS